MDDFSEDGERKGKRRRRDRSVGGKRNYSSRLKVETKKGRARANSSSIGDGLKSEGGGEFAYPWKKYPQREKFLKNWKSNFSKQWDVVGKWNFKNTRKMFGSLQFESLVKNGLSFEDDRLTYFKKVIDKLLSFNKKKVVPASLRKSSSA